MKQEKPNLNNESFTMEQNKPVKSEKAIIWEQKRSRVERITDKLGKGIDENIKETVTVFAVSGFTVHQSCEGHMAEDKRGASFPWVEIYAQEPEDWEKSKGEKKKEIEREWTIKNLEQRQKMTDLLAEFYQERESPFDVKLTFDRMGAFGAFRVQSFGAATMGLLSAPEQIKKLELYRKEMDDFTKFLKDKYFAK